MIPPAFILTVAGVQLDGDMVLAGVNGEWIGRAPEDFLDRTPMIDGGPVEISLTFKAWIDYEVTRSPDGNVRLHLKWRHA